MRLAQAGNTSLLATPGYKEESILVGIFESDKTSTPTFINRRQNIRTSFDELIVVFINIRHADEEMHATPASQHRLQMLGQRDPQPTSTKLSHRRFGSRADRLDLHPQHTTIKRDRFFEAVDFEKQQVQPLDHLAFILHNDINR